MPEQSLNVGNMFGEVTLKYVPGGHTIHYQINMFASKDLLKSGSLRAIAFSSQKNDNIENSLNYAIHIG